MGVEYVASSLVPDIARLRDGTIREEFPWKSMTPSKTVSKEGGKTVNRYP